MSRSAAAASIARPIPAIPETTAPLNLAEHGPTRKCCKINEARKWNNSRTSYLPILGIGLFFTPKHILSRLIQKIDLDINRLLINDFT